MIRRIAQCALFSAIAIVISSLERFIPLQSIIPLPGIKLGLANCVILFVLLRIDFHTALTVLVTKCLVVSLLFTGLLSLVYSCSGGLLALCGMYCFMKCDRWFSVIGVSVTGAALHQVGQICAAALLLGSVYVFNYLPVLLLVAIVTGIITGVLTGLVTQRVKEQR